MATQQQRINQLINELTPKAPDTYKHEGFHVGDRIRAWDFERCPGRSDRYVEGVITAVVRDWTANPNAPYAHYVITVDHDTVFPAGRREEVCVPMEMDFLEFDYRVEWMPC